VVQLLRENGAENHLAAISAITHDQFGLLGPLLDGQETANELLKISGILWVTFLQIFNNIAEK